MVVGIGGATASGKSTLSDALFALLPNSVVLRQDVFYLPEDLLPVHDVFEKNWDVPESFDNDALRTEILRLKRLGSEGWERTESADPTMNLDPGQDALKVAVSRVRESLGHILSNLSKHSFILVEGICLYSDRAGLLDHLDHRLWISCPEPILKQRREARAGYLTNEGSVFVDPEGYWEGLVWPAFLETNEFLRDPEGMKRMKLIEHDSSRMSVEEMLSETIHGLHRTFGSG